MGKLTITTRKRRRPRGNCRVSCEQRGAEIQAEAEQRELSRGQGPLLLRACVCVCMCVCVCVCVCVCDKRRNILHHFRALTSVGLCFFLEHLNSEAASFLFQDPRLSSVYFMFILVLARWWPSLGGG